MSVTILGQLIDSLGHSSREEVEIRAGQSLPVVRTRAWHTSAAELRSRQPAHIPLTADHQQQIGKWSRSDAAPRASGASPSATVIGC